VIDWKTDLCRGISSSSSSSKDEMMNEDCIMMLRFMEVFGEIWK